MSGADFVAANAELLWYYRDAPYELGWRAPAGDADARPAPGPAPWPTVARQNAAARERQVRAAVAALAPSVQSVLEQAYEQRALGSVADGLQLGVRYGQAALLVWRAGGGRADKELARRAVERLRAAHAAFERERERQREMAERELERARAAGQARREHQLALLLDLEGKARRQARANAWLREMGLDVT